MLKHLAAALVLLALLGVAGCGDEPNHAAHGNAAIIEAFAGVYEFTDFQTDDRRYAYDAQQSILILSRQGAVIVCTKPGGKSQSHPMVGSWRVPSQGRLEMVITHLKWSDAVNSLVWISGCGDAPDPIMPLLAEERLTCVAQVEQAGFRWPKPLRWHGAQRPLCVRMATPAWAEPFIEFAIPESARFGLDPERKVIGTYTLDRARFATTLEEFGFWRDPDALAESCTSTLEVNGDGTFTYKANRAFKQAKWRRPVTKSGRWFWHNAALYLRLLEANGKPIRRLRVERLRMQASRLHLRGHYGKAKAGSHPDWAEEFDLPYELVRVEPSR